MKDREEIFEVIIGKFVQVIRNIFNQQLFISEFCVKIITTNFSVKQADNNGEFIIIEIAIKQFNTSNTNIVVVGNVGLLTIITELTPRDKTIYYLKPGMA